MKKIERVLALAGLAAVVLGGLIAAVAGESLLVGVLIATFAVAVVLAGIRATLHVSNEVGGAAYWVVILLGGLVGLSTSLLGKTSLFEGWILGTAIGIGFYGAVALMASVIRKGYKTALVFLGTTLALDLLLIGTAAGLGRASLNLAVPLALATVLGTVGVITAAGKAATPPLTD